MLTALRRSSGMMRKTLPRVQVRTKFYVELEDGDDPVMMSQKLAELLEDDGTEDRKIFPYHETKGQKRIRKRSEAAVRIVNKQIGSAVNAVVRMRRK